MNMLADANSSPSAEATPRWRSRSMQRVLLILLVCAGVSLRIVNLGGVVYRSADERSYTWEAQTLLQSGTAGFGALAAAQRADPGLPGPTRAGYLILLAHVMQITGHDDVTAGSELACAASIVSVMLVALIAWRSLSAVSALAAVLLYAVSPMALMTARRAWEEALVEMLALILIFIACEITAGSRSVGWTILFACTGAFTITVKEISAASFFFCALWVIGVLLFRRETKQAILFAGLCAFAGLSAVVWLMHLVGGWHELMQFGTATARFLANSPYSIAYESGAPWLLLYGLWIVSATGSLLVLAALPYAFPLRRPVLPRQQIVLALALFSLAFLALAAVMPHHLNLRYVCVIFAPLYLLAGVGFDEVLQFMQRHLKRSEYGLVGVVLTVFLLFSAGVDYYHFKINFAATDMQDLSIRMVLTADAGGTLSNHDVEKVG